MSFLLGSSPVEVVSPSPSQFLVGQRTISNAEILALNATPLSMVAAVPGTILCPIAWCIRSIKTGAGAWTTSPTLSLIHEGNTTAISGTSILPALNTAAAIDHWFQQNTLNTATFQLLTFNRFGLPIQVRSTNVPVQGAGSDATINIVVVAYAARL